MGRLNRNDSSPVITPTVAAQIYSKTCLFKFPENEENNRINMLADKKFIEVERFVFENCDKLSNSFFADALQSFSHNHAEEQGAIRPRMFDAIAKKVCTEVEERIGYLPEADLGSVCRSLVKLPIFGKNLFNEIAILDKISDRISSIENVYVLEGVSLFVSMLQDSKKLTVLSLAIEVFNNHRRDWDHYTLVTMARAFSAILLSPRPEQQLLVSLRKLFNDDPEHVVKLMDSCILNVILVPFRTYN